MAREDFKGNVFAGDGAAVHFTEVGDDVDEGKAIVEEDVFTAAFELELLGELVDEIHVNF